MKLYVALALFCLSLVGFSQDLPKNPMPGRCYFKPKLSDDKFGEWQSVNCKLLKKTVLNTENLSNGVFTKKDRKTINRKIVKLLKKGYNIKLYSHYFSNKSDSINEFRSIQNGKALLSYLLTQGVKPEQLQIIPQGNSEPLVDCKDFDCSDYYNKNTRIEYCVKLGCLFN